jgi:hypothetical protein
MNYLLETIEANGVKNIMANKIFDVYKCDPETKMLQKLNEIN